MCILYSSSLTWGHDENKIPRVTTLEFATLHRIADDSTACSGIRLI